MLQMSDSERLKFLKLLPLSMYFELHDILCLVSLLKNKHDLDLNTIIHKNESRTRQATRGEIAVHATRLKKSNENYYIRSNTLYNYFSQIVVFENQDYDSLKISLTNTYWKFFNRNFAENNLCMWRILCWCGNCNPPRDIDSNPSIRPEYRVFGTSKPNPNIKILKSEYRIRIFFFFAEYRIIQGPLLKNPNIPNIGLLFRFTIFFCFF